MTMTPLRYRVDSRQEDTEDTVTLVLTPVEQAIPVPRPGQFTMVYAFGVGEVPISVSGRAGATGIVHTLRAVGAVTRALHATRPGDVLGVRGPYGVGWFLPAPPGADLVVMAGGIGLAPLRPVIRHTIGHRDRYRRVAVLVGARTPADLLYPDEYEQWRAAGVEVRVTVDRAGGGWTGHVGVVTTLLDGLALDPATTTAFVCGPEVMMRFAARELVDLGVPAGAVQVSLERNMRCGTALCGHCQLGPLLVCRDGPVVGYDRAAPLMSVKEL
jgi:NAD(P)H-flavin reductase